MRAGGTLREGGQISRRPVAVSTGVTVRGRRWRGATSDFCY